MLHVAHGPCWCGSGCTLSLSVPWPLPCPLHWPGRGLSVRFSHPGGMASTVWRVYEKLLIMWRWTCAGSGLCGCGWDDVIDVIVCLLLALWTSGGQSKFLGEWGPWGTGWCCCGCVLAPPFRPSFRLIKWTLPALAATAEVIEWKWLVIFYLMDVFHVVCKVICAPPPISLKLLLYLMHSVHGHPSTVLMHKGM